VRVIEYWVHLIVYEFILVVSISLPLLFVLEMTKWLSETTLGSLIRTAGGVFLIGGFLCASWVAHCAARTRCIEGQGFFEALGDAISEFRLNLSFVPVIGRILGVRRGNRSPFDGPGDLN